MKIVSGKNLNPFFKIILSLLKKTSPSLFLMASPHVSILIALILNLLTFQFQNKYGVYNLSVENEMFFSMFPKGDYIVDFFYGDEIDDFIYGAKIVTSLASSVKIDESYV